MVVFIFSKSTWNVFNFRKNLIKSLVKNKYKVFVIAKKTDSFDELLNIGCKVINLNFDNNSFNIIKDFFTIIKIFILVKKYKPKVFLNFNIKPVIIGSLVCKFFSITAINTITGLGNAFLGNEILKKISIFLYKYSISSSDYFFFHNNQDKKLFIKNKITTNQNSSVVMGSGVDTNYFYNTKFLNNNNLIFIGRLLWNKGIKEFLEVTNYYKDTKKIKFKVLGSLTSSAKDGITKENINIYLSKYNFKFLGFKKDVRSYIKNSDCVILPSYREGASKILLEAASMGRPLLSSNCVGSQNIVLNNKNGFIFKVKNIYNLKNTIDKFLQLSKKKKIMMAKKSRYLAVFKFNEMIIINKYLNLIKKVK